MLFNIYNRHVIITVLLVARTIFAGELTTTVGRLMNNDNNAIMKSLIIQAIDVTNLGIIEPINECQDKVKFSIQANVLDVSNDNIQIIESFVMKSNKKKRNETMILDCTQYDSNYDNQVLITSSMIPERGFCYVASWNQDDEVTFQITKCPDNGCNDDTKPTASLGNVSIEQKSVILQENVSQQQQQQQQKPQPQPQQPTSDPPTGLRQISIRNLSYHNDDEYNKKILKDRNIDDIDPSDLWMNNINYDDLTKLLRSSSSYTLTRIGSSMAWSLSAIIILLCL